MGYTVAVTTEDPGSEVEATQLLQDRITARLASLTRAERRVAEYLRNHGEDAIFATAEQIGAAAGTSDATVVRTVKRLGYAGLLELKYAIGQHVINGTKPSVRLRHRIEQAGESSSLLGHVFAEATERLTETLRQLSEEDFEAAVDLLAGARSVLCFGVGPSESVARYLALRLGRLGREARSTGATGFRLADDLLPLAAGDVVVLYSPSRLLPEITVLLDHASTVGAKVVLVTDSLGSLLGHRVAVVLPAVHSPSGFTGEGLSSQVITDALVLGVAARDERRSTATSELLTSLRSRLTDKDTRDYVSRSDRRAE